MKKKKKRTSFPFHIRNASFWLSVPDARDKGTSHTELWVLLSFRQGYHVQELPVGILQSRKCCKNKNKRHCRRNMSGKLIGSKTRSHARTKETLKWGGV
jgi:hypothetical protein